MRAVFNRGLLTSALLIATSQYCGAQELSAESIMETMEKVAAYFMESNPDVGAESHVGGTACKSPY